MSERSAAERLLDEAIDLLIRLQEDPANPVTRTTIDRWRARSTRHEQIWQKVFGAHGLSGEVLNERKSAQQKAKRKVSRRKFVIGGLAGLGAVTSGAVAIPEAIVWASADHITPKGKTEQITLADGTRTMLGPQSAIALQFTSSLRRVELIRGMAYFDVAAAPNQPFLVSAGRLTVTATGTAFDISNDAGFINIAVAEGAVETRAGAGLAREALRLDAGEWLSFDDARIAYDRGSRDVDQIATWRKGLIIADREPIVALVAKIARWHPGRIVFLDPAVGEQRISGIFDLSDTRRALAAIVHPAGARLRDLPPFLTVISPI